MNPPSKPIPKLDFFGGFYAAATANGRIAPIGGGATADGTVRLILNPPGTGAIGGGAAATGGAAEIISAISALAAAVPSALQTGQFTMNGIRPFTGSTSNLNF
jgi:hypothetical protein